MEPITTTTEILKVKGDWQEVVDNCRTTVGKPPLGKEPSEDFKMNILISEHSPIRALSVVWKWENLKSWVATHWSRHKWECYIKSQRSDRTGVNRDKLPQDAPVDFTGEANCQQLIDTMRKRLCRMSSLETRRRAEDLKDEIAKTEPELARALVPNCIYRCGCPELKSCGYYDKVMWEDWEVASHDIRTRYAAYDNYYKWEREHLKKKHAQ